jgi:DNA primase|tara:strand:+ start:163 stop:1101 length:939 start_codon:yes stop_codon:yes gene_type:complete
MRIVNLLNRVVGSNGRLLNKANEYMYWSPFVSHHKPKLQINIKTQKWHCWISNQGGHNLFQLFKKVKATKEQFDELSNIVGKPTKRNFSDNVEDKKIVRLPNEFKPLWLSGGGIIKKHCLSYLSRRGINMSDIVRYNIGYCSDGVYGNRIIIPSYNAEGELNYFVGRDIYKGGMKYKNPPVSKDVIGFELFINWDEPIVLCEGSFDAIAIRRNAIPLFGKTIPKSLKMKIYEKKVKEIYILLDSDAIKDSIKITDDLMRNGINVYFVNLSEEDPSDMGFRKVINLIKDTKQTSFSDLMRMRLNGKTKRYMEI